MFIISNLFEKIIINKDISLSDITNIEEYLKRLVNVDPLSIDRNITKEFPFDKNSFIADYKYLLQSVFEEYKGGLIHYILNCKDLSNQIFETRLALPNDIAYITYLFDINKSSKLINTLNLSPKQLDVPLMNMYSRTIVTDKSYSLNTTNNEPIIMLKYPISYPGFFIIDGNHRVTKAFMSRVATISGYELNTALLPKITCSKIFDFLFLIHINLVYIALYMTDGMSLSDLKSTLNKLINETY